MAEQFANYLSKLQEQEKERDQAEGVYDPLMNINWDLSASEKEVEFRETIVNYLMDQISYDVLVENLKKQIPKEEMQTLLDSLVGLRLFIEKSNSNQKTCGSSAEDKFSSEKMLADVFHNISKEIWPHEGEEPNYSMAQFPAMEQTPPLEPIGNDSKNSSAFQVYFASFLGFEIGGLCGLDGLFVRKCVAASKNIIKSSS